MMDELDILRRLSSAAGGPLTPGVKGGQGPPRVDVAGGVLTAIAARRERTSGVLAVFAGVSLAAAAVLVLAAYLGGTPADPLADMFNTLAAVMP